MIEEILTAAAPKLAEGGLVVDRSRTLCTLYSNRGVATSSVVVFVFSEGERAPRLIVKLSSHPEALRREHAALRQIAQLLPERVPRALACGDARGVGYLVMECIDAAAISPGRFERHAADLLGAIGEVHERVRDGWLEGAERQRALGEWLPDFRAWCDAQAPELRPLAEGLEADLGRLGAVPLPRIPQHGDCVLNHVLPRRAAGVAIIDWEEFGTVTVPGYDVTVLFATLAGRSALVEPGLRRLLATGWSGYAAKLGLDRRWLPVLLPLHLILFLRFCLAGGRETPAGMVLGQLRHWARGRGRDLWGPDGTGAAA